MCEQCKITRISGEPLPAGEDPIPCEYPAEPDEDEEECLEEARYLVSDYSCQDHLCEEHMREKSDQLESGLGDFLRSAGFQAASDFAPIQETAECDYVAPEAMLTVPAVPPCGKAANYAELILERLALCPRHAKAWGYACEP
ncbi:MAG: hypothetical protein HY716_04125 [Planctomycetes bacterium]|nr:hypothetical protein [Planctomycetota bacterium]